LVVVEHGDAPGNAGARHSKGAIRVPNPRASQAWGTLGIPAHC
jgi:hypothetical protein